MSTRFERSAAARTAQRLNMTDMARDVGIAPSTAKQWLSILQASGLICLQEPFHTNVSKRMVKTPKLYFLDSGLATDLTQWCRPATLEAGAMSGAMFESWVVAEMLKCCWHCSKQAPLHYYRDRDQKKIEIKKTSQPGRDTVRHFSALEKVGLKIGPGAVICLINERLPI